MPREFIDETRDSIARYLERVARTEVGTVLGKHEREIVGFCAAWVRNELDLEPSQRSAKEPDSAA